MLLKELVQIKTDNGKYKFPVFFLIKLTMLTICDIVTSGCHPDNCNDTQSKLKRD